MQIIKLCLFVIVLGCASLLPSATFAQKCAPFNTSIHPTCSDFGDGYHLKNSCGNLNDGYICCCPPTLVSQTSPKLIIIFSLVGLFAILTIGILIYKKNDQA